MNTKILALWKTFDKRFSLALSRLVQFCNPGHYDSARAKSTGTNKLNN